MKTIFLFLFTVIFFGSVAGQSFITSELETQPHASDSYGRDFWFCIPQNADATNHSDKYFQIYIAAYRNTTVHMQVGNGPIITKPVKKAQVTIFNSPTSKKPSGDISVSTELTSSGVVESTKGVHVWSDDAELSVYF